MQITKQGDNTFTWTGISEGKLLRLKRLLSENRGKPENPITTDLLMCVEKALWKYTAEELSGISSLTDS